MQGRQPAIHYLRRNDAVWTPPIVISLDSETRTIGDGPQEVEELRCWSGRLVIRRHRRRAGEAQDLSGITQEECAAQVDRWASIDKTTWLYAHNVAFDLITTGLPAQLARLGWELSSRHAVSSGSPWLVLHKGRQIKTETRSSPGRVKGSQRVTWQHTLTIADSWSMMPVPLVQLEAASTVSKPPLPAQDDDIAIWLERCQADTRILSDAITGLMDWWEANDLGRWTVSGASAGWNTYRHTLHPKAVTIDPDPAAIADERAACYGGRRDMWRYGSLPEGRYAELDFEAAYTVIAAQMPLPCKRIGPLHQQIGWAIAKRQARYGAIAEVTLETDKPRWPCRIDGRVFYPVGRFRTWLAAPELQTAYAHGALKEIHGGHYYHLSDHMRTWAEWILSIRQASSAEVPHAVKVAAKSWGRSVIGKWGQRGWSRQEVPGPPSDDWTYEDVAVLYSDAPACLTGLAGRYYLSQADEDGDNAFPAILATVESHVRARLARVIDIAPDGVIVQCDTDGILADVGRLAAALDNVAQLGKARGLSGDPVEWWADYACKVAAPLILREKTSYRRVDMLGPQHQLIDGRPRFSGVPRSAWQTGDGAWAAQLWPSLPWQLRQGQGRGYVRPVQAYTVRGPYCAGWVGADGAIWPVEARLDADGANQLQPWRAHAQARAGARLGPLQAAWSDGLWDDQDVAA